MSTPPDRQLTARRATDAVLLDGVASSLRALGHRRLWVFALAGLVLDVGLTAMGLQAGLVEANPVAYQTMRTLGVVGGLFALKSLAVAVAVLGGAVLPAEYRAIAPLALALPWWFAVVVNATMLATVL